MLTHLDQVLTLGHVLSSDLDLGLQESLQQITGVDAHKEGDLLSLGGTIGLSLLASGSHLELHLTHVQDGTSALVERFLLFLGKAEDTEGFLHGRMGAKRCFKM